MMTMNQMDLRGIAHGWEQKILSAFDGLNEGQALEILVDWDPTPLHFLLLKERTRLFRWENREKKPDHWKIRLLRVAHGLGEAQASEPPVLTPRPNISPRPAWIDDLNPSCGLFLDIRPLTEKGLDPFQMIVQSAKELKPGQHLHLVQNEQPESFICALGRLGYEGFAEMKGGVWNAYFRKGKIPPTGQPVMELDVRRLTPPLPLLKVLESLPLISSEGVLKVFFPNRPDSLIEKLQAHGFEVKWEASEGGAFVLWIWKK